MIPRAMQILLMRHHRPSRHATGQSVGPGRKPGRGVAMGIGGRRAGAAGLSKGCPHASEARPLPPAGHE
jgi:hypothetical protein